MSVLQSSRAGTWNRDNRELNISMEREGSVILSPTESNCWAKGGGIMVEEESVEQQSEKLSENLKYSEWSLYFTHHRNAVCLICTVGYVHPSL